MGNIDINGLLQALSKMDKKDLEAGFAKANQFLQTKDTSEILNQLNEQDKS